MKTEIDFPQRLPRKFPSAAAPSIRGRKLVAVPSLFGDDVWRLNVTAGARGQKIDVVDFMTVPDRWRRTTKLLTYAYINEYPYPGKQPHRPSTAYSLVRHLRYFWEYLDSAGVKTLNEVDQKRLNNFFVWLLNHPSIYSDSPHQQANALRAVRCLYDYREFIDQSLPVNPWGGKPISRLTGVRNNNENTTPRIPEQVAGPLLAWALFYVNTASHDILRMKSEVEEMALAMPDQAFDPKEDLRRLREWSEIRIANGRGIPKLSKFTKSTPDNLHQPDVQFMRRLIGLPLCSRPGVKPSVAKALDGFPLEEGGLESPVSLDPLTGSPWRERFHELDASREIRALRTACLVVLFAFTGMRSDEVFSLKRGCYSKGKSLDGLLERHVLKGKMFKRARTSEGEEATWVTIEPVGRAVEVLEALSDDPYLCTYRHFTHYWNRQGRSSAFSVQIFSRELAEFIKWINTTCAGTSRERGAIPSDVEGVPVTISTRSFRRTLAWYIANRPFGIVAGMIQYKHLHVATFEGYAGTSRSGFRLEVEAETALAKEKDIIDRYESFKRGHGATGPGVKKIDDEFDRIQREVGDFPGMIVDERRLGKMLRSLAKTLHPGLLVDCYFDAGVSLCAKAFGSPADKPIFAACDPTGCGCAYIPNSKLAQWTERQVRIEQALSSPSTTRNQRIQAQALSIQAEKVVQGLLKSAGGASLDTDGS